MSSSGNSAPSISPKSSEGEKRGSVWKRLKSAWYILKRLRQVRGNAIAAWPKFCYKRELVTFRVLRTSLFIINHPPSIQRVMAANGKNYVKSTMNTQALKPLLGDGLFVSEGELWTRQRRVMAPSTHTNRLAGYAQTVLEEGHTAIAAWQQLPADADLDTTETFTLLTAEIISRIMFGFRLGDERVRQLFEAFKDYQASHGRAHILEIFGVPTSFPRWSMRRGKKAIERFDEVLLEILEYGKSSCGEMPENLLDMLLNYRDEHGQPMAPSLVRDEMASIFLAGHETTAITLSWAFYLLERHPECEKRLHQELDEVLKGAPPTFEDLPKLIYARAVIDETLRLYPPVHVFSRQALAEDEIMGKKVPAKSMMVISSWLLHRHELLWDRPNAFRPDRFMPGAAEKIHPFAYIPFGAGARVCLGKHLGIMEAVLLLAMTAQKFRLRLRTGHPVEPLGRMTLRALHGIPMRFEQR
ncbi:MAG: cytochrome P450 [Verrucomicrobiota bacterium]